MKYNIRELLKKITHALASTSSKDPSCESWWLLEHVLARSQTELFTLGEIELTEAQEKALQKALNELFVHHKPIQYLLGTVPFCGLEITVRPPILIPRQETEEWCNNLIERLAAAQLASHPLRILDLCTGSGCIALALAHAFPQATVVGIDINQAALELARFNATTHQVPNVTFIHSDLFEHVQGSYDLIVSNPPYLAHDEWATLAPSVRDWEDPKALVAGKDGLELYRRIIIDAPSFIAKDSILKKCEIAQLIVEIGIHQAAAIGKLLLAHHYTTWKTQTDLSGRDRTIEVSIP